MMKLAYPTFDATVRGALAKDFFVRGLDKKNVLKSSKDYSTSDLKTEDTVRLELGTWGGGGGWVGSGKTINTTVNSCESGNAELVEAVANKVLGKMKDLQLTDKEHHMETQEVRRSHERQGFNKSRGNVRDRGRFYQNRTASRKYRSCQSLPSFDKTLYPTCKSYAVADLELRQTLR